MAGTDGLRLFVGLVGQKTAGIHQGEGTALPLCHLVVAVAGDTVAVADHGGSASEYTVEQGGLAHIGPSDYTDYR